jgi:hypothetical protein
MDRLREATKILSTAFGYMDVREIIKFVIKLPLRLFSSLSHPLGLV